MTGVQTCALPISLDATGFAKVTTARLSYPILRSQASNVTTGRIYSTVIARERRGDDAPRLGRGGLCGAGGVADRGGVGDAGLPPGGGY